MEFTYLQVEFGLGKLPCEECFFCTRYQDMGASWLVCTFHSDLGLATKAVDDNKNCSCRIAISKKAIKDAVIRACNEVICNE